MPKKVSKQDKKVKDIKTNNKDIFSEIAEILAKDKRFIKDDNTIDKIGFRNAISSLDEILLKKFYDNTIIKARYFKKVGDLIVFDKTDFMYLFENVQFLGDSYTRFKSDIGLIDKNEKYIVDNDDVVLSFPFKDCVLEFDSTDVNDDREEYFINERISKEKIDVMFENKVFANCKRIDKDGEKLIDKFDINDNLLIKGNNLLAMETIKSRYKEQIQFMYWDILYNGEKDKAPYANSFKHSSWLVMMKNRLEAAYGLLKDNGSIAIQCDDVEMAYLKVLMDEIFGRRNKLSFITIKVKAPSGVGQESFLFDVNEYILIYAKNADICYKNLFKEQSQITEKVFQQYNKTLKINDKGKKIKTLYSERNGEIDLVKYSDFVVSNIINKDKNELYYKQYRNDIFRTTNPQGGLMKRLLPQIPNNGLYSITYKPSKGKKVDGEITYHFYNGGLVAWFKDSSVIENDKLYKLSKMTNLWDDNFFQGIANEGNVILNAGKKPEALLKRLISLLTTENDIIMDAYFGTGTTGAVAIKMNRRFIGIEQLDEHISEKAIPRLKNVINGDETGISKLPDVNWKGGGSFVYIELAKFNQNYIDKISNVKKSEENKLLSIYNDIKNNAYLNCYIDTNSIDSQTEKFNSLNFTDKKKFLIELLDKNQLYVNLMDIDDKEFIISDNDKKFTKSFYKKGN